MSTIDPSAIDPTKPEEGDASTANVRANELATQTQLQNAKSDIEALEAGDATKADKVSGATNGNLAGLDGTGNLTDSGSAPADFESAGAVAAHDASGAAHGGVEAAYNAHAAAGNPHSDSASNADVATAIGTHDGAGASHGGVEAAYFAHTGTGGGTHPNAVPGGLSGFMSGADKQKLDGIPAGAEPNVVDSVHGRTGDVVAAAADYDGFNVKESTENTTVGPLQCAVVATLPGTPDVNTVYFVTT